MRGYICKTINSGRRIGAGIENQVVLQSDNLAFIVKYDFRLMHIVASVRRVEQMLLAVFDPGYWPPQLAGQEGQNNFFGIDTAFYAETAANVGSNATHARFGQL